MTRGEVYWADLVPRSGSEQQGRRPVIVISHDAFNQTQNWRSIIVVPLSTSAAQAGRCPSAVLLPQGAAGLGKDSVALCHQVTTLDRSKLTQQIWRVEFNGTQTGRRWHQGRDGLAVAKEKLWGNCGGTLQKLTYSGVYSRTPHRLQLIANVISCAYTVLGAHV